MCRLCASRGGSVCPLSQRQASPAPTSSCHWLPWQDAGCGGEIDDNSKTQPHCDGLLSAGDAHHHLSAKDRLRVRSGSKGWRLRAARISNAEGADTTFRIACEIAFLPPAREAARQQKA